jgi:homoserine kinase type II
MLKDNEYKELLDFFNVKFNKVLPYIKLSGSPERCLFRICIEDLNKKKYILEKISINNKPRKQEIIDIIQKLKNKNILNVPNYIKSKNNEYIIDYNDSYFQLIEYIEGELLIQPDYLNDSIKGEKIAELLINIYKTNILVKKDFSIKNYIYKILESIKKTDNDYYISLLKIVNYLKLDFFENYDLIPKTFSHGDFHPLNIIWQKDKIKSLIDFEFFSNNLEMYDAANLIGCCGIENPYMLTKQGFSDSFIKTLKKETIYSNISYKYFIDLIIAIRFGWISEWFRKNDQEMKELELAFIDYLIQNKKKINDYYGF